MSVAGGMRSVITDVGGGLNAHVAKNKVIENGPCDVGLSLGRGSGGNGRRKRGGRTAMRPVRSVRSDEGMRIEATERAVETLLTLLVDLLLARLPLRVGRVHHDDNLRQAADVATVCFTLGCRSRPTCDSKCLL